MTPWGPSVGEGPCPRRPGLLSAFEAGVPECVSRGAGDKGPAVPDCTTRSSVNVPLWLGGAGRPCHTAVACESGFRGGAAGGAGAPGRRTTQTHRATFLRTALLPRGRCNRLRSPLKGQNRSVPLKTGVTRTEGGRRPVGPTAPASLALRTHGPRGAVSTAWRPWTRLAQLSHRSPRGRGRPVTHDGCPRVPCQRHVAAPRLLPRSRGPHGVSPPVNRGLSAQGVAAFPRARAQNACHPTPAATSHGVRGGTAREKAEAGPHPYHWQRTSLSVLGQESSFRAT